MIAPIVWILFIILVMALMAIDLGLFNKKAHIPSAKEAIVSTVWWVLLAMGFNLFIYFAYEHQWQGLGTYIHEKRDGGRGAWNSFTGNCWKNCLGSEN